jgi:hypothetical protein
MAAPVTAAPSALGESQGEARLGVHEKRLTRLDWRLVATIAAVKLAVLLLIFLAYSLLPFWTENFEVNVPDPAYLNSGLARAYSTWDAQHYLYLSENGYRAGQMENAFFPLFPLLIRLATYIFHSSLIAALVIANLCSLAGFYLLFTFVEKQYGRDAARLTVLLYLAFPTAFFFDLPYSESLFLLLIAAFFLLLFRGKPGWAAIPAALLPLSRPEGVLVILPFATYYATHRKMVRNLVPSPYSLLPPLSPLLGLAAYLAFMRAATGNAFEMFRAMQDYVSAHSLLYLLHPLQLIQHWAEWPLAIHGFTNSIIDRAFFLAFLLLIAPMVRRVHPALAVYALAVGLLNVLSGTFMSYTRYILLAFPVFLTLALLLRQRRGLAWQAPLLVCSTLFQGVFLVMHALNYWVA